MRDPPARLLISKIKECAATYILVAPLKNTKKMFAKVWSLLTFPYGRNYLCKEILQSDSIC